MQSEILEQYEQWHKDYNDNLASQNQLKLMIWHKTALGHLLKNDIKGKRILDVGCGNGDFANYLSLNFNADITALDFSKESIKIANTRKTIFNANTSNFLVGDAQNLPFEENSFDFVVSCECLEHVPNPQKMIDQLFKVVKKDGFVILTTENYSNAYAYYILFLKIIGKKFDSGSSLQPIEHFFVYWKVKKKFILSGFREIKTFSKEYILLLLPGSSPKTFTIQDTSSKILKFLLKPLGRRFTYVAKK